MEPLSSARSTSTLQPVQNFDPCTKKSTVNVHLTSTAYLTDMARFHIAAALGVATLALLITFQLISHFGLPALDFMHLTDGASTTGSAPNQYPISSPYDVEEEAGDDGTLYNVGVGKADITGYGFQCWIRDIWRVVC